MPRSHVIGLDVDGRVLSTQKFVDLVAHSEMEHSHLVFVIGGAYGYDRGALDDYIDDKISLSSFTLPHGLALLVLLEQIYRVRQIQKGSGYHHG